VGWLIAYENIACSSLIKSTLNFLMDFPRLAFDTHKAILSLVIFTQLYLTLVKMLKGFVGAIIYSIILWFYLFLIGLPMLECCHEWKKKVRGKKNIKTQITNWNTRYLKKKRNKQNWKKKSKIKKKNLVGRYTLLSFLTTWRANKQNMSTRPFTLSSFFDRSIIDMFIPMELLPFIKCILCPNFNMLAKFATTHVHILQFLIINF